MKILCVCQEGNKRSVVTRYVLNRHGHEALACGVRTNTRETLMLLCQWADKILVAEPQMSALLPGFYEKIDRDFTIGPDIYKDSIDRHLKRQVEKELTKLGYV